MQDVGQSQTIGKRNSNRDTARTTSRAMWRWAFIAILTIAPAAVQAQTPTETPAEKPAQPQETPATVDELLDRALVEIRTAEAQGTKWPEAFERANHLVGSALKTDPENPRAKFYYARLLILSGRGGESRSTIEAWTRSRDGQNDWEGYFLLARIYEAGQFFKLAKPVLLQALELNPREPRILVELSKCSASLFERTAAVKYARDAIKMMGNDVTPEAYRLMAGSLLLAGQIKDAERAAKYAINLALEQVRSPGAGLADLTSLDTSLALDLEIKQKRIELEPTRYNLYVETATLIQQRAEVASKMAVENALAVIWKGLQTAGDDAPEELAIELPKLLARLGRREKAIAALKRLLEMYPNSTEGKRMYELMVPPETPTEPAPDTTP
jgi:tetratricopeptide (TPR) repeat protein